MALDTKLIGQALAGPRPIDVGKTVSGAIAKGEQAFERRRIERKAEEEKIAKEEKERQNLQARAIAGLKDLDKSQIPPQLRDAITKEAFALKKGAMEIISNKNLDPITAQLEVQKYMQGVNDLAVKANDFKEWYKQFADTTQDDLSKLNNSLIYKKVNDIAKGNFKYQDGMFALEGEEPMAFEDMMNIRHINRRSDTYLALLENTKKAALTAGSKNGNLDVFKTTLTDSIDASRMTDADIASVLVDELGYEDEDNEIRKQIKIDFEADGSFDDKTEDGKNIREKYLGIIKEKLISAGEERFFEGKKAYNEKLAATPSKVDKDKELVMRGSKEAFEMIKDPQAYFRRVSSGQTTYDPKLKQLNLVTYSEDEKTKEKKKEITSSYDLSNRSDIIRLFNEIQNNAGYSAAQRQNLQKGILQFVDSPAFKDYLGKVKESKDTAVPTLEETARSMILNARSQK